MKYELAIFDMDGTILDTLDDLADSVNYALAQSGFEKRTVSEVRQFVGNGILKLVQRAVPTGTEDIKINKVFEDFKIYYKKHCADKTKEYSGITEMIKVLRKNGMKTAVVSNKADFAVQDLCKKYFDGLFDFAVGEKTGVRKKPYADSVNEVLENLKVKKENSVYIGDSEVDIQTGENAQMDCISVEWGFRDTKVLKENGARLILSSVSELQNYLLDYITQSN